MATKFCIDCVHRIGTGEYADCRACTELSPVTGGPKPQKCYAARWERGACGPDGKLWEQRPPFGWASLFWKRAASV
jgi:hypothetical protein